MQMQMQMFDQILTQLIKFYGKLSICYLCIHQLPCESVCFPKQFYRCQHRCFVWISTVHYRKMCRCLHTHKPWPVFDVANYFHSSHHIPSALVLVPKYSTFNSINTEAFDESFRFLCVNFKLNKSLFFFKLKKNEK